MKETISYTITSDRITVNIEIRLIILFAAARWRSSTESSKTRLGADCGSDHELLIAKFRLRLKKIWKIMRPLGYDQNQYSGYTVEVTNRFKWLDLIDQVPEEPWMDRGLRYYTGGSDQDHPQEKEMQKGKMVVW